MDGSRRAVILEEVLRLARDSVNVGWVTNGLVTTESRLKSIRSADSWSRLGGSCCCLGVRFMEEDRLGESGVCRSAGVLDFWELVGDAVDDAVVEAVLAELERPILPLLECGDFLSNTARLGRYFQTEISKGCVNFSSPPLSFLLQKDWMSNVFRCGWELDQYGKNP